MSNFFGFHGEKAGMSAGRMPVTRRKKPGNNQNGIPLQGGGVIKPVNQSGPPMVSLGVKVQPNSSNHNTMNYNGMYNVPAIQPPPINSRPSRKTTTASNRNNNNNIN